jgi:hypothetical protein
MKSSLQLLLVGALCTCTPAAEELTVTELCVYGNSGEGQVSFAAGAPLRVSLGTGTSGCRLPCDTVLSPPCTIVRDGHTFRVSGRLVVQRDCGGHKPPPACSFPNIGCETEPVTAGDYVVTDGVRSLVVRVPQTRPNGSIPLCAR